MCEGDFPVFIARSCCCWNTYEFYVNGTQQTVGVTTNTFDTSVGGFIIPNNATIEVRVSPTPQGCLGTSSLTMSVNSWSGTNSNWFKPSVRV